MHKDEYRELTEYLLADWTITDKVGEAIYHPCANSWDREAAIPAILIWHDYEEDALQFVAVSPSLPESQRIANSLRWAMEGYSKDLQDLKLDEVSFVNDLVCMRQVGKINAPQPMPIRKVKKRFGRF